MMATTGKSRDDPKVTCTREPDSDFEAEVSGLMQVAGDGRLWMLVPGCRS